MLVTVMSEVCSLRTAAGLSQGALAAAIGVSRQTINAIDSPFFWVACLQTLLLYIVMAIANSVVVRRG